MANNDIIIPDNTWLQRFPGAEFHFIARRRLTAASLNNNQKYRFLIPAGAARSNLFPIMEEDEITQTIPVDIYSKNGWHFKAFLTTYESSGQTVILGGDFPTFSTIFNIIEGDEVTLWAFRQEQELCFGFEKII